MSFPLALVQFSQDQVDSFRQMGLDNVGQYDLELLFVLFELVQFQEETNYPGGWVPTELYAVIRDDGDNLDKVAYHTEVVTLKNETQTTLAARGKLHNELKEIAENQPCQL